MIYASVCGGIRPVPSSEPSLSTVLLHAHASENLELKIEDAGMRRHA